MVQRLLLALVLAGSGIFLAIFLLRESQDGSEAIRLFLTQQKEIADGQSNSDASGESAELQEVYKNFESVSVRNYQTQASSSCFWTTIGYNNRSTDVIFVLRHTGPSSKVITVSLHRECECPIDFDVPCALRQN
jgi:hypothetical protein